MPRAILNETTDSHQWFFCIWRWLFIV